MADPNIRRLHDAAAVCRRRPGALPRWPAPGRHEAGKLKSTRAARAGGPAAAAADARRVLPGAGPGAAGGDGARGARRARRRGQLCGVRARPGPRALAGAGGRARPGPGRHRAPGQGLRGGASHPNLTHSPALTLAGPQLLPLPICAPGGWPPPCAWARGLWMRALCLALPPTSPPRFSFPPCAAACWTLSSRGRATGPQATWLFASSLCPIFGEARLAATGVSRGTCARGAGREGGARRAGVPAGGRPAARGRGPEPAGGGDADERARPRGPRLPQPAHQQHRGSAMNPTPSTGAIMTGT
jgi:hypothetical protein